jgi:hypothetical protein
VAGSLYTVLALKSERLWVKSENGLPRNISRLLMFPLSSYSWFIILTEKSTHSS